MEVAGCPTGSQDDGAAKTPSAETGKGAQLSRLLRAQSLGFWRTSGLSVFRTFRVWVYEYSVAMLEPLLCSPKK